MTQPNIDQALRRPARAWAADGIPEIAMGAFWLVWGGVTILPSVFPGSLAARYSSVILVLVMIPFMLLGQRIVQHFKIRLTCPRTGYLAPRKPSFARRIASGLAGLIVAVALVWSIRTGSIKDIESSLPLVCALMIGAALFVAGVRLRISRLQLLGCGSAAVGGLVTVWQISYEVGLSLVFLGTGLLCAVSGVAALLSFIKNHPAPEQEQ
jgi:hypothetical protein